MLHYSHLNADERQSIRLRDEFRLHTQTYWLKEFHKDYLRALCDAVSLYVDSIDDKKEADSIRWHRDIPLYSLEDENIIVYMLMNGLSGGKDAVVLQLKKEPHSYAVITGESLKRTLNEGLVDFVVPGKDFSSEMEEIGNAWSAFSAQHIKTTTMDESRTSCKTLSKMISRHDPSGFIARYLYPINTGFWDSPGMYAEGLRSKLPDPSIAFQPLEKS